MHRYYHLTTHPALHPPEMVHAKDYDAARDAMRENKPYPRAFSADEFAPDSLCFTDFIKVDAAIPMVSKRFRDAMLGANMDDFLFYETIVMYGPENLMNWIGDDVGGLYCATYRHVVDVIDDIDPVRFWPHLKRFKAENFVVTRPLPEGARVAVDRERPYMPICTEGFKTWCEEQKLNVGFFELPTFVADAPS